MPTITVNGMQVQVGDEFASLSPEQQDATVDEIAASMQQEQGEWRRGMIAPVEKNEQTGALRFAVPQIALGIADAFRLPGDAAAGRVPDLDPRVGARNMSDDTFARVFNAGAMMAPAGAASRATSVSPNVIRRFQAAVSDDNIPLGEVNQRLSALGPNAMAMDLGINLQQRAGGLASVPGPARQQVFNAVEARARAAGGRLSQDVQQALGAGAPARTMVDEIAAQQSAAAAPLYEAVRNVAIPAQGNIAFVMQTPMGRQAFEQAARMAANDGMAVDGMTIGLLDYAKRALDDVASSAVRSGNNNQARQASNLASILTREADQLVPEYAQARDTFAGFAALRDAVEAGTNLFKRDNHPMEFARSFQEMSASERDALLQGARSAIEDAMGNAVNDATAVRNLLSRPYNRQKLEVLLGPDAAGQLIAGVERELAFSQTRNVVTGNSITAARQVSQQEAAPNMASTPSGGPWEFVARIFAGARNRLMTDRQKQENQSFAQMLMGNQVPETAITPNSPWARIAPVARAGVLTGGRAQALDGASRQIGGGGGF